MPQLKAQNATAAAADFITRCFAPAETIALLLRRENPAGILQQIVPLERALALRYLGWRAQENSIGANIYLAANPLHSGSRKRTKESIAAVRHLYRDLDIDGEARLASLRASEAVPTPNAIVSTSLGEYQIFWRVDGFSVEQQEGALKLLAITFGGDPACTDCNRVLRLPGFLNSTYDPAYLITVEYPGDSTWNVNDFRLDILAADAVLSSRTITRRKHPVKHSNSERDWACVLDELAKGTGAAKVTRKLALRRSDKPILFIALRGQLTSHGPDFGSSKASRQTTWSRCWWSAALRDSRRTLLRSCAGDCADGTEDDCPEKDRLIQVQYKEKECHYLKST